MTSAICPQCLRVTEAATGKCTHCDFPLGKDPELYAVCFRCNEWKLIAELTEDKSDDGAWYCDKCLEERKDRRGVMSDYEARLIESERRYDAAKDDILTEGRT
jgi:hypothetical protein